jgi:hypothetical protein
MMVREKLLSWMVLLVVVAGLAPWAPAAMAQDGTPAEGGAVDVAVTEIPAEIPFSEPVATEPQVAAAERCARREPV